MVTIPAGISVAHDGAVLTVKKNGVEETYTIPPCIIAKVSSDGILLTPQDSGKITRSIWGTSQRNISNMVIGLDKGFKVDLEMIGVGYKASVSGNKLVMQLGFSHDIEYEIPKGITITCSKPTLLTIGGHSKKQIGDVAAFLRSHRKPEPYKGKGIIKMGEFVYRKEGKKK
jgi:large subunit ribosomal protein L6